MHRLKHQMLSSVILRVALIALCGLTPMTMTYAAPASTDAASARAVGMNATKSETPPGCKDPFYKLYQNCFLETVSIEGTVKAVSPIPDPAKNDYPNCLYALLIEVDSVLSNSKLSDETAKEIIVDIPIMKDKAIISENIFRPDDKISCICAKYDTMPQNIQEIQLSDDIQLFEYQQYYALRIKKISDFSMTGKRNFAGQKIIIPQIQKFPADENAKKARRERMQKEILRIEQELKKHGGTFRSWQREYMLTTGKKYQEMRKIPWKGWINDSYFSAEHNESGYKTKEYINGILPYKKYLENNNIDLIILRIPFRGDFAARVLASDEFQENPVWLEHYYNCLINDIEIVDPMPEMWKHRFDFPLFYFYHISREAHPFEGASFIAAKVLSEVLKRYDFEKTARISLEPMVLKTNDPRFFLPAGNKKFNPAENLVFSQVVRNGKTIGPLEPNTGSPFLFLSNSMFAYPWRRFGASIPGYTAYFTQHIPDWFYQDGIGNQMIRNLVAAPELLNRRKAVIMVGFSGGWRGDFPPIPKYLEDEATEMTLEKTLDLLSGEIDKTGIKNFTFFRTPSSAVCFTQNKSATTSADENGQNGKRFQVRMIIPPRDGKKTCMLRINFERSSYLTITALNEQLDSVIDTVTIPGGKTPRADLYIPVSNAPRPIYLRFTPYYPKNEFWVKNIQLWYY